MTPDEMQRQVDNRRRALTSRRLIDEAVVAVQRSRRCNTDEAFTELWEASDRDETELRNLARRLSDAQRIPSHDLCIEAKLGTSVKS